MNKNTLFAKEMKKCIDNKEDLNWNEFFDRMGVPMKSRSDFLVACITNQYNRLIGKKFIK